MRCIALAQAWQRTGGHAIFAMAEGAELEERIRSEGIEVVRVPAKPGSREDADQTANLCANRAADWLVLDGYHFSGEYRRSMQSAAAARLLLIDDGAEPQPCKCDVILNPDPDASPDLYGARDGQGQLLLGPRYALLRQEFLEFRTHRRAIPWKAERVLITFGGGDAHNVTLQVFEALRDLTDLRLEVTVVVGASYQHWTSLQKAVEDSSCPARLLWNVNNMPELMAGADLAVTAGGGTCYELAFMRVPMYLITMAKNHERAAEAYASVTAALYAGWFSSVDRGSLGASLRNAICDRALRSKLVENASRLVDGKGAERVVETMNAIFQSGAEVTAGERGIRG